MDGASISYVFSSHVSECCSDSVTGHEESFKDVPRLSTIQGMILILKAREAVPKRGYYYRSWMTCQYLIAMAKDLGLDDHNRSHIQGHSCGLDDCAIRTRIWHTLFQIEMMVGGPQGDYSIFSLSCRRR